MEYYCVADRVLLCAKRHNFESVVALAQERGLGVEVQTFGYPDVLDGDWKSLLRQYQSALHAVPGSIAMHAPFMDMASGSPDRLINEAVHRRAMQALEIAVALGARTLIFHANFIASIRNLEYRTDWTDRQIAFWTPLAETAWDSGVVITLENMWEFDPAIIGDVLRRVERPGLRACLDVGHTRLFSDVGLACWLEKLNDYIVHVHLNNNSGVVDEHHGLQHGVLDYTVILPELRRLPQHPAFSLEIERLEDMALSLSLFDLA